MIIAVVGLIILAFTIAFKSTKGALSFTALKNDLNILLDKFSDPLTINAETERAQLERLVNGVKAHCNKEVIAANLDLGYMMDRLCKQIKLISSTKEVNIRSSWQKLKDSAFGFDESYFTKTI